MQSRAATVRLIVPGFALVLLGAAAALYHGAPGAYAGVMRAWMLAPFAHPFIDWEFIPSSIRCWSLGVDVYRNNTCYAPVANVSFAYSPLWLRAGFLPAGAGWTNGVGLGLAAAFCVSLGWLPACRNAFGMAVVLGGVASSAVAFALERGNIDVIVFVLAVAGARLWGGGLAARLGGYAVFGAAALLKFYPAVLLALAVRERPRVFAGVLAAACLVLALFVGSFGDELSAAGHAVPAGSYFTDFIGAVNLPKGVMVLLDRVARGAEAGPLRVLDETTQFVPVALFNVLAIAAILQARWIIRGGALQEALRRLPGRDLGSMVAGAALVGGCFFAGQSVGYRGMLLLLVLPGMVNLAQSLPCRRDRAVFGATCGCILFVMWGLTIQFVLRSLGLNDRFAGDGSAAGIVHWVAHELAWWWIAGVLLSVLAGFALNSMAAWGIGRRLVQARA